MSPFKLALVTGATLLLAAPAVAQTVGQASGLRQDVPVRIQTSFNFFVPGPNGESEEAKKSRDNARRAIYEMAAHECDLLREVLAKECRLESVSNNIGRQYAPQQQDGYNVNGTMSFQIMLK